MAHKDYATNAIVKLYSIFEDANSVKLLTVAGKITVQDATTKLYWTGVGIVMDAVPTLLDMTKVDDTNSPAMWEFLFNTAAFDDADWLFEITDGNALAVNVPQRASASVGGTVVKAVEASAALALGKAVYNHTTSKWTIYAWDDASVVLGVFDIKDVAGAPATTNTPFQKIPE